MSGHIPAQSFECRKWQYRQTKEGVVVSLLIHPNDVTPSLAMAALGTRFMVALAEIGDDEKPKEQPSTGREAAASPLPRQGVSLRAPEDSEQPSKPRVQSLSEQCALRCKDKRFWEWLREGGWACEDEASAINCLYRIMSISSRAELDSDESSAGHWKALEESFQHHLTSQMHAGSYR